jgi:hypothetical protein
LATRVISGGQGPAGVGGALALVLGGGGAATTLGAAEAVALGACCSARAGWHATTTIESPSQRRTPQLCHGAKTRARSWPSALWS